MVQFPMTFKVSSTAQSGIQTTWQTFAPHNTEKITVAVPPEFSGPGGGFSPEDIYAMALTNCFVATFKVYAEKSRLEFNNIQIETTLKVDRNEKGHPWMAEAELKVELTGVSQTENAKRLLEKTSQGCMILNSVNTVKKFEFNITN
jgi:organic hydroperoxide reductase OsmC/OhrA